MSKIPTPFEQEHPEAGAILMQSIGRIRFHQPRVLNERNALCGCGSGRKTKQCCALIPKVTDWRAWSAHVTVLDGKVCDLRLGNR